MKNLQIRKFVPSDLSRIVEIESNSFTVDAYSEATFNSWYRRCPDLFIVAEIGGKILGYMITCILPDKGDIVSIAVDPLYRRKGVGRALANFTFRQLRSRNLQKVELEVRTTNVEGIRFWKNLGFFSAGVVPSYYRDGTDACRMRKLINKEDSNSEHVA